MSKAFAFYFLGKDDNTPEYGYGENVASAFSSLGYTGGAIGALDYYKEVDTIPFDHKKLILIEKNDQSSEFEAKEISKEVLIWKAIKDLIPHVDNLEESINLNVKIIRSNIHIEVFITPMEIRVKILSQEKV